jgi:hypothetical protein
MSWICNVHIVRMRHYIDNSLYSQCVVRHVKDKKFFGVGSLVSSTHSIYNSSQKWPKEGCICLFLMQQLSRFIPTSLWTSTSIRRNSTATTQDKILFAVVWTTSKHCAASCDFWIHLLGHRIRTKLLLHDILSLLCFCANRISFITVHPVHSGLFQELPKK